jgi:hypothetical protein
MKRSWTMLSKTTIKVANMPKDYANNVFNEGWKLWNCDTKILNYIYLKMKILVLVLLMLMFAIWNVGFFFGLVSWWKTLYSDHDIVTYL